MEHSVLVPAALGFLIGFAVEWALDLFVWRRRRVALWETDLGEEVLRLRNQVSRLDSEARTLEPKPASDSAIPSQSVDDSHVQTLEADLALRADTIAALEARIQDLEADLESRDRGFAPISSAPRDSSSVEEIRELSNKAAALERDVESLRAISAAKDQAVAQSQDALARLEAQLSFRPSNEDLQKLTQQIASRDQALESLRASLAKMQEAQESSEFVRASLEARLAEKEQALASAEAAQAELGAKLLEQDDLALKEEVQRLAHRLSETEIALQSSLGDLAGAEKALERYQDEVADLNKRVAEQEAALADADQERLGSQQELSAIEEAQRLARELGQRDLALQNAQSELARAEEAMERFQAELAILSNKITEQETALAAAETVRAGLEQQLRTPDAGSVPGTSHTPEIQELARLRTEIAARDTALNRLDELVTRLQASIQDLQSQRGRATGGSRADRGPEEPRPVLSVTSFSSEAGGRKDPLIQIRGIGHLFERKLWDAGINTFGQLASLSTDQIMDIIQPAEWQRIEPEQWIADAAALSLGTGT